MNTYKVYEAEERTTPTGKKLKRLVLMRDGAQHPTKNVTVWGDNPLYAQCNPGGQINCDLLETDSGTPNPNAPGKNYINRTVANPNQPLPTPLPGGNQNISEMAIKSHIDSKFAALQYDLKIIADFLGVEPPKQGQTLPGTNVVYPDGTGTHPMIDPSTGDMGAEEINPEDIPF